MTGWRIGWMILPEDLIRPVECLAQSLYISAPELSQIAAEAALSGTEEMERGERGYQRNRSLLAKRLPALGSALCGAHGRRVLRLGRMFPPTPMIPWPLPARCSPTSMWRQLPGRDFDPVDGARFMRFSYAGSHDEMETALDRIECLDWKA
jgi:aspartate/methionine/tyrosine aminotransferase